LEKYYRKRTKITEVSKKTCFKGFFDASLFFAFFIKVPWEWLGCAGIGSDGGKYIANI